MNHQAKKRFGQNFLHDQGVIDKIVRAINPSPEDNIVEIGPGLGAITGPVLKLVNKLNAVEIDQDVIPNLQNLPDAHSKLTIHQMDALKFDFSTLAQDDTKLRAFGNLPYNISTPLIFHLLSYQSVLKDMHFMLQKEVVERICAPHGSKTFGRLSVMVQYHCKASRLFNISAESFKPRPKVASSFVRLVPIKRETPASNEEFFSIMVRDAFNQRRKTLRNALKSQLQGIDDDALPVDLSRRAETLSVEEFIALSNAFTTAVKS